MASEKFVVVDPLNEEHRRKLIGFENQNDLLTSIIGPIDQLHTDLSEGTPYEQKKDDNNIETDFMLEKDSRIIDYCHIHGERDIKTCRITIPVLKKREMKRKILLLATDYAMRVLEMEEVFINLNPQEKELSVFLEREGYESLGALDGNTLFLKEKGMQKGINHENIK